MWAYEGPNDSTRMSPVELSANELAAHVRMIDCAIKPYGPERPFEEVSFLYEYFCFVPWLALICFLTSYTFDFAF